MVLSCLRVTNIAVVEISDLYIYILDHVDMYWVLYCYAAFGGEWFVGDIYRG